MPRSSPRFVLPVLVWLLLVRVPPARAMDPKTARGWQTGAFAPDRLEHASLSFTSGLAIGVASREPVAATGGALALGIAKELWDRRRTGFDPGDLAADAVGALLAGIVSRPLER